VVRRLAPAGAVTTFIRAEGTATRAEPTAPAIGPGGGRSTWPMAFKMCCVRARLP
jgi:hypothetical protein